MEISVTVECDGKCFTAKGRTVLAAMEMAGAKDMPENAEGRGLGTPATRASILEKLVSTCFVERKKAKKTVTLLPIQIGVSLVTVPPEQLQSPAHRRVEKSPQGNRVRDPGEFMDGAAMLQEHIGTYRAVEGAGVLFPSDRETVGKCSRCGGAVTESKKGFFVRTESAGLRSGRTAGSLPP